MDQVVSERRETPSPLTRANRIEDERASAHSRLLWRGLAIILPVNILLAAFLYGRPLSATGMSIVDDAVSIAGPLALVCCVAASSGARWRSRSQAAPLLIALGILGYVTGSALWAYYELIAHQQPFPSWADLFYLLAYPFLLAGILLLPGYIRSHGEHVRLALDGVMVMVAAFTVSWYFVLGPTVEAGSGSTLAKVVGTAYPVLDLVLVLCVLLLIRRSGGSISPYMAPLMAGLLIIVVGDSLFDYQNLHGTYGTGSLVDVTWPLGYMLVGLGALIARRRPAEQPARAGGLRSDPWLSSGSLLGPYFLVLVVVGAITYVQLTGVNDRFEPGMISGVIILITLLVARQIIVLLQNQRILRERVAAQTALKESERRFRAMFDQAAVGVAQSNLEGRWLLVNQRLLDLYGYTWDELASRHFTEITHPDDVDADVTLFATLLAGEIRSYTLEKRFIRKDGGVVWANLTISLVRDDAGDPQYTMAVVEDIGERRRAEEALRHLALHDPLTGLPNRSLLEQSLEQTLEEAERSGTKAAVLILDLDRFKEINDTYGHHYGDRVLIAVARQLREAVDGSELVTRLGGDEFALLLPDASGDAATRMASRLGALLERPVVVDDLSFRVSASIGIALFPDHGADVYSVLRSADIAMSVAKDTRGGPEVYNLERDSSSPARLALIADLADAIGTDQIVLHYQPKVHLTTRRCEGVEALVRWQHPRRGIIPPGEFIPLAEKAGLMRSLTMSVLDQALQQVRSWHDSNLDVSVAVNLSAQGLHDPSLVESILELLDRWECAASWLELEITESAVMADPEQAVVVLGQLHDLGIRLSVDDFGTGYSSLSYLKMLPVDMVKVDRSFVQNMAHDPSDATIVRSIIDLGHNLGVQVVAEGVEDGECLHRLRTIGCDYAQGYHWSRPLPAVEATTWLLGPDRVATATEDRRKTLLVIDDDLTYLKLLRVLLSSEGYDVVTVASGEDAVSALREVRADMILVDLRLAGTDGLELTRRLRRNPSLHGTVIVGMSAHADVEDFVRARAAGCDAFVPKPHATTEITRLISWHLAA